MELVTSESGTEPSALTSAFAAEDSHPSGTPDPHASTPPAAVQPGTDGDPVQSDDRSPFIPRARFDEVNTKLAELKAWREQHGWVDQVDRTQLEAALGYYGRIQQDPVAAVREQIQQLQAHPIHGPQLRSLAAQALASGRQAAMPPPDVEVTDDHGLVVAKTYSDQRLAQRDQWLKTQLLQELSQQFAPVQQTVAQLAEREAYAVAAQQASSFARTFTEELATYPGFTEHKAAIGAEVARALAQYPKDDPRYDEPAFLEALTLRAYHRIVTPTLTASAEARQLDTLKRHAAAGSSVRPNAPAATTPTRPTSFYDPALAWK